MRVRLTNDSDSMYKDPSTLLGMTALNHLIRIGDSPDYAIPSIGDGSRIFGIAYSVSSEYSGSVYCSGLCFIAPVHGRYTQLAGPRYKLTLDGVSKVFDGKYVNSDKGSYSEGDVIRVNKTQGIISPVNVMSVIGYYYLPTYKIKPSLPLDTGVGGTFGPETRPGNVTGDYGYVGEDGSVTSKGDTYFFDESSTTYHNPVTGDTSNVTEWNYDYSDRSYNVVTDSGNTVTITYGDENVSVTENTINESGDTITNNYTYYYITNNTAAPDNPDVPHTHNYTGEVTQAPTCIMSGVKTFSCSCGDSYTQNIPATGHSWIVKETVLTKYDETGNLVQQGYTIFKCSVCGEENKSETSVVPPASGGSGSGGGSGGSGGLFSGLFSIIWDFFSFFWSFFNDFVVGGIKSFLSGLLSTAGSFLTFLNPFNWFA